MAGLQAEITMLVDGVTVGPFALPRHRAAEIGRSPRSAMRLRHVWVPRLLAILTPSEGGWMLSNGTRTRARVKSRWADGYFQANSLVAMQQGTWDFTWDLDGECRATAKIDRVRQGQARRLPVALSPRGEFVGRSAPLTDVAGARMKMSPQIRHRLAVLFAYEIKGLPAPPNICRAAAERIGVRERDVLKSALRIRDRVNALRLARVDSLEELGFYLSMSLESSVPTTLIRSACAAPDRQTCRRSRDVGPSTRKGQERRLR